MKPAVFAVVAVFSLAVCAIGPQTSSEEFFAKHLDCSAPALAGIPEKLKAGDVKGAERIFAAYARQLPVWESAISEWRKPNDARAKVVAARAKETMDYKLSSCGTPIHFKDRKVDWEANPTYNGYDEWPWQLSRHPFLTDLAEHYARSGDENAAKTWVDMLGSWFDQAVYPGDKAGPCSTKCWRTIEAGIRMEGWARQMAAFRNSPNVPDEFVVRFFRSVYEHGRRLRSRASQGNWLIMEMHGLVRIALFYPFLRDAKEWRAYATDRLEKELTVQVRPDGFQIEQTTGYQHCVIANYRGVADAFRRAGEEPPAFIANGLEKMYEVYAVLAQPDGKMPNLNDGGAGFVGGVLKEGLADYPANAAFKWFVSRGKEGAPPKYLSCAMPWSGIVVFRTSWKDDAIWALFDGSEHNEGWHMHEDALNFTLSAYGKTMLSEQGSFLYDSSEMRKYVISTRAHNTVMFDSLEQNRRKGRPVPKGGDSQVKSSVAFKLDGPREWATASFADGYGRNLAKFAHKRGVVFFKDEPGLPPFFAVVDRFTAPDEAKHSFDELWHLETSELKIAGNSFVADFGKGVSLAAFSSDPAPFADKKGQKKPVLQGWFPIHKSGEHEHRPIPTPVQTGEFAGAKRVVTLFFPLKDGASSPIAAVKASASVAEDSFTLVFPDGRETVLGECCK